MEVIVNVSLITKSFQNASFKVFIFKTAPAITICFLILKELYKSGIRNPYFRTVAENIQ